MYFQNQDSLSLYFLG